MRDCYKNPTSPIWNNVCYTNCKIEKKSWLSGVEAPFEFCIHHFELTSIFA